MLIAGAYGQIPCVSGFVTDPNGNPVADADLDFDDAITGQRIYTPGDNTDPNGFYTVCVLPGIYHISYAPYPNSNLLGHQIFDVDLSDGSPIEINVVLNFGEIISGTVKDRFDNPIGGVDLDADRLSTGQRIYTPDDNSDSLTGEFWIVVPPDFYRLRFEPPRGSRWKGLQLDTLDVHADTAFDVILEEGSLLYGTVTDTTGQGIDSISIDLRDQITGRKIYVANGKTDSTGFYTVAVDTGLFVLRFEPPRGSRYVGVAIDSFAIAGDTPYDQTLQSGFIFTAVVTDSLENPVPGADIDFILERTDEKIFTPYDETDSLGMASFAVLPDTYAVRAQPPPGTLLDRAFLDNVVISSDTTLYIRLGEIDRVNLQGMVKDRAGNGLPDIEVNIIEQITGNMLLSSDNHTDTLGFYDLDVPLGTYDFAFIPPRGNRMVALKIDDVTFEADTVWEDVVLDSGYIFSAVVYDDINGTPVEDVRFDFTISGTGAELFTPHNLTDYFGTTQVSLLSETYSIEMIMPDGSNFIPYDQTDLEIDSDTSLVFILRTRPGPFPDRFLLRQNFPNPFNNSTAIHYFLFEESRIEISIYNSLGQKIRSFEPGNVNIGEHSTVWDGTDNRENRVSSGVYFYKISSSFGEKTRKMLLIK
ncbi:MAG: T9SS type A sorting domain-containing protein [Candidatus Zixiibacteriota bacterium]|nr:MAG: T9SS type A sorting domain-containing protein [candidate division Zixibacteria bacterium]